MLGAKQQLLEQKGNREFKEKMMGQWTSASPWITDDPRSALNVLNERVHNLSKVIAETRRVVYGPSSPSSDKTTARSSDAPVVDGRDSTSLASRAGRFTGAVKRAYDQGGVGAALGATALGIPGGIKAAASRIPAAVTAIGSIAVGRSLLDRIPFAESFSYGAGRRDWEFTSVPFFAGMRKMQAGKAMEAFNAWHPFEEFRDSWWTQPRLAVTEYLPMASLGLGKRATLSGFEGGLQMLGSSRGLEGSVGDYLNQYGDTKAFLARVARGEADHRARIANRLAGRNMGAATLDRK